jgi:DNA primase catalytic core
VWRAAIGITDTDRRPTGGPQLAAAVARYQGDLDRRAKTILGDPQHATTAWAPLVNRIDPRITDDDYWPDLANRLAAIDRAGIDVRGMLTAVTGEHTLPDEQPAAALWWRLSRHLTPASTAATAGSGAATLRPAWTPILAELLSAERAKRVTDDPAWPALVAAVDTAPRDEWTPDRLTRVAVELTLAGGGEVADADLAPALVWRIAMLTDPAPLDYDTAPPDPAQAELAPPDDLHLLDQPHALENAASLPPSELTTLDHHTAPAERLDADPGGSEPIGAPAALTLDLEHAMHAAALLRGPLQPTDADLFAAVDEQLKWRDAPVPKDRLIALNQQAANYYSRNYPHSWAAHYLRERLGTDLLDDDRFTPGYAPPGAYHLVNHLRRHGATDQEILAAGLGRISSTGRLIDQFRDRLVFPIHGPDGHIQGFIGRRNPTHDIEDGTSSTAGPKYLNTPDTDLFTKGSQLFGLHEGRATLAAGATPTLVEGPIDAIAITLAADGTHVGAAPLGTAFTELQANQLLPYIGPNRPGVLVATDADQAGWKAAQRAYWHLVARGANPGHAPMPAGSDPAHILQHHGPGAIRQLLATGQPLAHSLIDDGPPSGAGTDSTIRRLAAIIAALPPQHWIDHLIHAVTRLHTPPEPLQRAVIDAARAWTDDPRGQAHHRISAIPDIPPSLAPGRAPSNHHGTPPPPAPPAPPTQRWADTVAHISPALLDPSDWPSLAHAIDRAHAAGYNVAEHLPRLAAQQPLSPTHPARDLQYRLVAAAPAAAANPSEATRRADRAAIDQAARRRLADHDHRESTDQTRTGQDTNPEQQRPEDRWRNLIGSIDARILTDDSWTALAATLDLAAATGLNVADELPRLAIADGPLPSRRAAAELSLQGPRQRRPRPHRAPAGHPRPITFAGQEAGGATVPIATRPANPAAVTRPPSPVRTSGDLERPATDALWAVFSGTEAGESVGSRLADRGR